jgi:type I restriction enzyme, R subunit
MRSLNFEFLRPTYPELADLAGFAEAYAYTDPMGAVVKLRNMAEAIVDGIYLGKHLPRPYNASLLDLLQQTTFKTIVPIVVQDKLHLMRRGGNQGAHGKQVFTSEVLQMLGQAFDASRWFYIVIGGGKGADCPPYQVPPQPVSFEATAEQLKKQTRDAEQLALATREQLEQVLAQLESARLEREAAVKTAEAAQKAAEQAHQSAALTKGELEALKAEGQHVADLLQLDEETTRRRLIDTELVARGWKVGADGKSTEQVGQEIKVTGLQSDSGLGIADYVLWGDDGKPLAVIEAKRASKDMEEGRTQAKLYADALEKKHGQRPVIFYSNGRDIGLWDDAQGYPPRQLYSFYGKDSLEYLILQRATKQPLAALAPDPDIAGRLYQLEAIRRVAERFGDKHRDALLVQATGTGKTRVAISICELLQRAGWVKRILFLCDRTELRKQAYQVFNQHLKDTTCIIVSSKTTPEEWAKGRVFLATYPAMMERFEQLDPGFFQLVIADESHRSIYNKFRDLFLYFDALAVGLTATPVKFIDRNTFRLFGCDDQNPTSNFGLQEAIENEPPYLVPFEVLKHGTKFRREGIKYSDMTAQQRAQLEEDDNDPESVEFDANKLDKDVFNEDTTHQGWQVLMERGIKVNDGTLLGKTIVFARSHRHAVHMGQVFSQFFPQYGGGFCRIIDNQEPRAEQLIDDFKDPTKEPVIAISVDMLDTGIDVPEVVNLVFAKPVRSYVKFWQMIGRGTRLCDNLFGPGKRKSHFLIVDQWNNFEFFAEKYVEKDPVPPKSLLQQLFEARIALAVAAQGAMDKPLFESTVALIHHDLQSLREVKSFSVKERWKELEQLSSKDRLAKLAPLTRAELLTIAAPLMQWRDVRGDERAYRFDLLCTRLSLALLQEAAEAEHARDEIEEEVELLLKHHAAVQSRGEAIKKVKSKAFWKTATPLDVESLREDLRGVMQHQGDRYPEAIAPRVLKVADSGGTVEAMIPQLEGQALMAYKARVLSVIQGHFEKDPTLLKIKARLAVSDDEVEALAKLILEVDDKANLKVLAAHAPETRRSLAHTIRSLVGLDAAAVEQAFTAFAHAASKLSAQQLKFIQILKNHIVRNGGIEFEGLYDAPFDKLHPDGIEGVFAQEQIEQLKALLASFDAPPPSQPSSQRAS